MWFVLGSAVGAGNKGCSRIPQQSFFWSKLVGFGQIWLDLGKIKGVLKVCLYRTRTRQRLGGVREGMVEIKQIKVVHTESDRGTRL